MNCRAMKRILSPDFLTLVSNYIPKRTFARSVKKPLTQKFSQVNSTDINPSIFEEVETSYHDSLKEDSSGNKVHQMKKNKVRHQPKEDSEAHLSELDIHHNDILACRTTKELFHIYEKTKRNLTLRDCVTILNRLTKLSAKEGLSRGKIVEDERVRHLITHLKTNFHNLSRSLELSLLINLVKLKYEDLELMKMMLESAKHKSEGFNQTTLAYLVWALARFRIRDEEFLCWAAEKLLEKVRKTHSTNLMLIVSTKPHLKIDSAANVLWGMSQLNFPHPQLIQKFSDQLATQFDKIEPKLTPIIFHTFSSFRLRNYEILEGLSGIIIENIQTFSIRNIANIVTYCSSLNYINNRLLETLEHEILKQLKPNIKSEEITAEPEENVYQEDFDSLDEASQGTLEERFEEMRDTLLNGSNEEINAIDISQLMVGFCRLKMMKSELFEVLEAHFLKNIQRAPPKSLMHYSFAHSMLCTEIMRKIKNDSQASQQPNRKTVRNIKKHNEQFYERVTPFILRKLNGFSSEEVLSFLMSASKPLVTKRSICKQIFKIGLDSISKLTAKKASENKADFQKFLILYHETLTKFIVNKSQISELNQEYSKFGIDTSKLNPSGSYVESQAVSHDHEELPEEEERNEKIKAEEAAPRSSKQ